MHPLQPLVQVEQVCFECLLKIDRSINAIAYVEVPIVCQQSTVTFVAGFATEADVKPND
jgi:hypothetical protein